MGLFYVIDLYKKKQKALSIKSDDPRKKYFIRDKHKKY